MPAFCCVVNCNSRGQRDTVRFFRIPSTLENYKYQDQLRELAVLRRQKWLAAIKRDDLTEEKLYHARVCSKHFVTGEPAALKDSLNPDWIPSLHLGYGIISEEDVKKKMKRNKRKRVSQVSDEAGPSEVSERELIGRRETEAESSIEGLIMCYCAANGCLNTSRNRNIKFFSFPRNIERARDWVLLCGRLDLLSRVYKVHSSHKLCHVHFENKMFMGHLCKRLHHNAIPTLFPLLQASSVWREHNYSKSPLLRIRNGIITPNSNEWQQPERQDYCERDEIDMSNLVTGTSTSHLSITRDGLYVDKPETIMAIDRDLNSDYEMFDEPDYIDIKALKALINESNNDTIPANIESIVKKLSSDEEFEKECDRFYKANFDIDLEMVRVDMKNFLESL